jgi:HEAT repeat protein/tRNA A-37 threonylcarbamoyl transferase component Bud32
MRPLSQLIGGPRIRAQLQALYEAPDLQRPASRALLQRLRAHAAAAFEELLLAAVSSRRDELDRIAELMAELYSEAQAERYLEALADPRPPVAMAVARALARQRLPQPQALIALLDHPGAVKAAVFSALAGQSEQLPLGELLRAAARLGGADRVALFELMGRHLDPAAVPGLVARLDARDADYRLGVVRLLGRVDAPAVIPALARMLGDRDWRVRLAAIEALGEQPGRVDLDALCSCLSDPQFEVQARAIEMLSASPDPQLPQRLAPLLGHESAAVRRAAVEVLSAVATVDNVRALLQSAHDRDWWVRSRSADVLGRIGGPRVLQAVRELLRDSDAFIRRTAVEILNAAGGTGSFEALAGVVRDPDWWVRERAIDGIAACGDGRGLALLRRLLVETQDEPTQLAVIRALSQQDAVELIGDLAGLLGTASSQVCHAALQALGRLRRPGREAQIAQALAALPAAADPELQRLADELQDGPGSGLGSGPDSGAPLTPRARGRPRSAAVPRPATAPRHAAAGSGSSGSDHSGGDHSADRRGADAGTEPAPPAPPAPAGEPAAAPEPGSLLGQRYRVLCPLGRGAFGSVLLVEDTVVHEQMAMKFLHAHLAGDDAVTRRFIKELRLARRVTHPGIVRIYDLVHLDGTLAITMEYFPSHALTVELRRGPMALERVRHVALQLATAMAAAHAAEVIHRDLKPANVLIDDAGTARIADFGISAALSEEGTRLTGAGTVLGTPRYMSPEQVRGQTLDERSDIYSLGIILYEMLAARTPYSGDSLSMMYQHVRGAKEPPSTHRADLPPALDEVVMRCLAVNPAERFASMKQLAAALAAALPE